VKAPLKLLLLVVTGVVLVGIIAFRFSSQRHNAAKAELRNSAPELADRIERNVATLSKEVEEGLTKLADVNSYHWPNDPGRAFLNKPFPLEKMIGQADVEAILSNGTFHKLMDDLSRMDKRAASKMVSSELIRATRDYDEMFKAEVERRSPHYLAEKLVGQTSIVGPTFVEGNVNDGRVVIKGLRLKVLGLVWLCGELALTDCRTNVEDVVRIAIGQRKELYEASTLHPFFREQMLEWASVYNRQILGSALLGLSQPVFGQSQSTTMEELGLEWLSRKLPTPGRRLTDLPVWSLTAGPAFYKPKVIAPIDDRSFDQLLRKLGISF